MSSAAVNAGEGVLVAVQQAAPGLFRPFDSEQATRFEAALEALAPNTRRAYGSALAAWGEVGRLAGRQRVGCAAVCAARLPAGAGGGRRRHLVAAAGGGRTAQGAGARRCRADRE